MLLKYSWVIALFQICIVSLADSAIRGENVVDKICSEGKRQYSATSNVKGGGRTAQRKQADDHLFTKWTKWSPCSRSCISSRIRRCKFSGKCTSSIEKEEAFCYAKDSLCYKWIHEQVCNVDEYEEAVDYTEYYDYGEDDASEEDVDEESEEEDTPKRQSSVLKCGISPHKNSFWTRIIGGRPSTKGHWPWQVAILNKHKHAFCGGTLISSNWILTAAHCMRKTLYVRLGEHNLARREGDEVETKVLESVIHPNYDADTVDNDLALLRVRDGSVSHQKPVVCLPQLGERPPTHKLCTIIGWGKKKASDFEGSEVLHQTEVYVMPEKKCREMYDSYLITENMFCAGHPSRVRDSCAGDSGGPLLCQVNDRWTIFGVTSFGEGCGRKGKFGVYTLVPNYIKWIESIVKIS
ncbi:vitamin K-dependent protein C-like [Cloeon dipterum]|uniref:vitamin K-dependent protein C-like n=1 Tax=Cloeon dipterum TaxID=197152 RepID=UPI0032200169